MGAHFKMNPNFERELREMVERNLPPQVDREIAALARRLKGKDRATIRAELERAGLHNIKDELVEAMHRGEPVPSRMTWR